MDLRSISLRLGAATGKIRHKNGSNVLEVKSHFLQLMRDLIIPVIRCSIIELFLLK